MVAAACAALVLSTLLLWSAVTVVSTVQLLVILLLAALLASWRSGSRGLTLLLLAGLPVVAASAAANLLLAGRWPDVRDGTDVVVSGSICAFPTKRPGSWRFVLTTDAPSRARGLPERVLISWYDRGSQVATPLEPGQHWRLTLRLRSPRGLSNPGAFDYERWLFSQHIGATGWVRDSAVNQRISGDATTCPGADWRAAIARRVAAALDGRPAAPYILGLAVGAYQALPEEEWDKLRRTGTIHLISISGFHIALVAGPAALFGLCLARLLLAAGRRCRPRVIAAWTGMIAAGLYGLLAGFSVPTVRSLVAVALVAVLATLRRTITGREMLGSVVLGVLIVEPLAPLVPGFWLSFAGVIVLGTVAMAFRTRTASPGPVRLLLVTQVGMTVGLAPLLIVFFGQLPLSGTLANLVAVPAFSFVLLPLTLVGTGLVMVVPSAGVAVLGVTADCFDLWRWFLNWCADLPLAVWYLPAPGPFALVLAGVGVVSALWPPPWPGRWLGPGMLAGLLAAGGGPVPAGDLRITVLDVGQGLSVFVQTAGHALLYDAGPAFRDSDAGERVVVPALQSMNVRHLDTLLISHPDADHRGGAGSVLARYPTGLLLGTGLESRRALPCKAGSRWRWDGFDFEILHPPAGALPADDNAGSCVLRISGAGASLLLPGDIPASVEETLVSHPDFGPADLVIAPHHGSRTSSSRRFVEATRPRFVVFSTGFRNRWRFPASEVLERWRGSGACALDTGVEGALQFAVSGGSGLRLVSSQRQVAGGLWLARPPAAEPCR